MKSFWSYQFPEQVSVDTSAEEMYMHTPNIEEAELRASLFEAIEEEDKVIEKEEGLPPALLGSCNERAKQLHNSPSGRLLTALICEYLDWAQLNHTLKVYLPECNLDSWKNELKEFSNKNGYDLNRIGDSGPLLLDVLEGFLKYENLTQGRGSNRRSTTPEHESLSNMEVLNLYCNDASCRPVPVSQSSGEHEGNFKKDEYNWRYNTDELPDDVVRASAALENFAVG
ncbi:UNVERIFIED_CONTAM: Protein TONNEAU 1b [Sesamum indicum]